MRTKQKESKDYDACLVWVTEPKCNFVCEYCITGITRNDQKMHRINVPSLVRVLENTKKTFSICFGGGEPFLVPNFLEACIEITKKHYIALITNLTSSKVKEFANRINPKRVISIIASAHIKELEKKNLLETYINNYLLLKRKGFEIEAIEVAYPPLLRKIGKYKQLFKRKGIKLKFTPFIGKYKGKEYPRSYTKKELKIFGIFPERYYQHKKICNAGYNVGVVFPNGNIQPCLKIKENIANIHKKIEFKRNLVICPFKFCECPVKVNIPYLFNKALKEANCLPRKINKIRMLIKHQSNRSLGLIGIFLKYNFPDLYSRLKEAKN